MQHNVFLKWTFQVYIIFKGHFKSRLMCVDIERNTIHIYNLFVVAVAVVLIETVVAVVVVVVVVVVIVVVVFFIKQYTHW